MSKSKKKTSKKKPVKKADVKKTNDKKSKAVDAKVADAKVAEEKVKPEKVKKKKEKPPREKRSKLWWTGISIGVIITVAVAAICGYYFANGTASFAQRYTMRAATAAGADVTLGTSPMYARTLYIPALLCLAIAFIVILTGKYSPRFLLLFSVVSSVSMGLTYFIFIYGLNGFEVYSVMFKYGFWIILSTTMCLPIATGVALLAMVLLFHNYFARRGYFDYLEEEEAPLLTIPDAEVQPS